MSERKVFVISDTHFLHENIVKYTGRPENHTELIIDNWNRVVSDDDLVFHLGDFSAGVKGRTDELSEIANSLKGEKILIRGNHDHYKADKYIEKYGFSDVFDHLIIDDLMMIHFPLEFHEHLRGESWSILKGYESLAKKSGVRYIVHGHTHNRNTGLPGHYNCSVEQIDFTPIELNKLLEGERFGKYQ